MELSTVDRNFLKKAGFLVYVSTVSIFAGFGMTVARARKKTPNAFKDLNNEGARLAMKALGYATLINISGFGLLSYGVCSILGVNGPKEFGVKMKEILPAKDGEFVRKFDNWPTKLPNKPDDGKWREEFK